MNWKSSKFIVCLLGCLLIAWLAPIGKLDGNVTMAMSIVIGGYYTANGYITGKSLATGNGK